MRRREFNQLLCAAVAGMLAGVARAEPPDDDRDDRGGEEKPPKDGCQGKMQCAGKDACSGEHCAGPDNKDHCAARCSGKCASKDGCRGRGDEEKEQKS